MDDSFKQGETLFAQGEVEAARKLFLDAVKADPNHKEGFNNLGVIAVEQSRFDEAIDLFMKSLAVDPAYLPAVENLCQLLDESGNMKEAVPLLEPLAEKLPKHKTIRKLLLKARSSQTVTEQSTSRSTETNQNLPADVRSMYKQAVETGSGDARQFVTEQALPEVKLKIAVLCLPGLESFLTDIIDFLGERHEIKKVYTSDGKELMEAIRWSDTVWLEWANELAVALTGEPKVFENKRVICRLHSYEAFSAFPGKINWERIDDLIFVGEHIREHVLRQVPDLQSQVKRIHVVPTGVDLDRYPLTVRQSGKRLAYLGYINYKKGPMLLLHAFAELVRHDSQYQLFMAGRFQDDRYPLYFNQMAKKLGIERNLHFDGWVDDVSLWLEDKQYIVSSSVLESQGMGILEGMARGLKPVVHDFVGAETVYPNEYLWPSISDFVKLVTETEYDSALYREFVAINYPKSKQMAALDRIIRGKMTESYRSPISVHSSYENKSDKSTSKTKTISPKWQLPEKVFSHSLPDRVEALVIEASSQLKAGDKELAEVSLDRLARMTRFTEENILQLLTGLYTDRQDISAIRQIWKRGAIAALEQGDLDKFLERAYLSGNAENIFANEPNYQFCDIDLDLNAFTRIAVKSHPLAKYVLTHRKSVKQLKKAGRPKKLKVGFVLEGFSQNQAASRTYFPLAEAYDRERYRLTFFSRWFLGEALAKNEKYQKSVDLFEQNGCSVVTPPERLSAISQVEFLAKAIVEKQIDVLVFQTTSFVPQYNFLSCLHCAPVQAAVEHQQPEYSAETDLLFTTRKQYPESLCQTAPFVMAITRENKTESPKAITRSEFGIPDRATLLTSVNRSLRYSQPEFWQALEQLMTTHPDCWFMAIGLDDLASAMPDGQVRMDNAVRQRIITPGFRTDVLDILGLADIYVDIFPSGGGSSIIEAMQVGLPVPCFEDDYAGSLFNLHNVSLGPTFVDRPEMVIAHGDLPAWHQLMGRLITDTDWRDQMGQLMIKQAKRFEPEIVVRRFFEDIENAYSLKMKP